jgi:inhibitor of cysteine peptidase
MTFFPFLLACFVIAVRAEASPLKPPWTERIDLCEKMIKGQVLAPEGIWNSFNLVAASFPKVGNEVKLSKGDNGKEITIDIGDILQIDLKRSGGTGYEWYLDRSYKKYFELIKEDTETGQNRGLVGTPVVRMWKLRAIEAGETDVRFFLYREWEGRDKAVETFKIRVRIL